MTAIPLTPTDGGGLCLSISALQPADLIVSTTNAIASGVIRGVTRSAVSHASVYSGGGRVIEAISEKGVVERSLTTALASSRLAVVYRRRGLATGVASKIITIAREAIGKDYDWGGAAGGGVRANKGVCLIPLLFGTQAAALSVACRALGTGIANQPDKFYCSELVLKAFQDAGVPLTETRVDLSVPQDIVTAYSRGVLTYVGHLKA
jgi:cell wall-associated NlpC family hydrolase